MNVLLGVDGSERSFRALAATLDRAREAGDDLTVACYEAADAEATPDAVDRRVRERLAETDGDASVRRIEGDPGPRLVELAETEGFDRIVVGRRESPLGKVRLDETAEFVLLNAQVPVTLVR